jgi:cytochrome c-type biogenesis protein CcmH
MMHRLIHLCLLILLSTNVNAEISGYPFERESQEQRFRELSAELRCLVCQNQSLADSNAPLAQDLRSELYRQVLGENTDTEIIDFMTNRYGDFVLYKPRFSMKTSLLWLTPLILFIVGIVCLFRFSRRGSSQREDEITEAELQKVRELLEPETEKK